MAAIQTERYPPAEPVRPGPIELDQGLQPGWSCRRRRREKKWPPRVHERAPGPAPPPLVRWRHLQTAPSGRTSARSCDLVSLAVYLQAARAPPAARLVPGDLSSATRDGLHSRVDPTGSRDCVTANYCPLASMLSPVDLQPAVAAEAEHSPQNRMLMDNSARLVAQGPKAGVQQNDLPMVGASRPAEWHVEGLVEQRRARPRPVERLPVAQLELAVPPPLLPAAPPGVLHVERCDGR